MAKETDDYAKGVETLVNLVGKAQADAVMARFKSGIRE
jgi:hypothetical protein